ncbi:MAG TPA: PCRF domain-containing protein, partial [Gammaproteobacteria bacterium]|nr:PCRF domain-containing protein [Gammaproteobacteria bacterium]
MKSSVREKLDRLIERCEEINALLSDPAVIGRQKIFRELSIELADLNPVVAQYQQWLELNSQAEDTRVMLADEDSLIRKLAQEELPSLEQALDGAYDQLQTLLLPKDPNDERNIFLEIRAGTGGDEAALFAGDLFRMYNAFADSQRWTVEIMNQSAGEHGGYREIISRIIGRGAYSRLKFESGAHRVQRVPATEAQGRIHTSACTV